MVGRSVHRWHHKQRLDKFNEGPLGLHIGSGIIIYWVLKKQLGLSLPRVWFSICQWFICVFCLLKGWGGIGAEVFLSLPCIMGSTGSTRLAGVSLGKEEDEKIRTSITSLSNLMGQLRMWWSWWEELLLAQALMKFCLIDINMCNLITLCFYFIVLCVLNVG